MNCDTVFKGAFSRALGGVLSPMVRSLVSKIVPNDEIGKVFALIVASESLIGMGGSPIFTVIYNATLSTDAGIYNFIAAGFYVFEILLAMYVLIFIRKWSKELLIYYFSEELFLWEILHPLKITL